MTPSTNRRDRADSAIWQSVEFGSYTADLPLWEELAERAGGPVLELGAGAGRVAMHLAARGHRVIALESERELLADLDRAAREDSLPVDAIAADLAALGDLELPTQPGLVIGPLHVIQALDAETRPGLLSGLVEVSATGATIALTVVDESTLLTAGAAATQILPDMRELDGWVYSSEPLWVQVGEELLTVRRLRERVSPDGRMDREVQDEILHRISPERLEDEATNAGLRPAGRRQISSGRNEADSTVVLLEVPE
jgi:SAM-dependent methyltransferase